MGKKEAQRTKGNTKAASSARSAAVLGDSTGFVGFGTAVESGFVPILQPDDGVPPDFRLAMRKMLKKDVTTKLKALQEFLDLCTGASEEQMLCVLAFWPSVYCKLATDTDRRVREQAHTALEAVVKAVGKNLAVHLKTMSGVWYLGQADPHVPAAQAAMKAWRAAFPPHKLAGAVEFCQTEILNLIIDNLTAATPQTLSDPKTTPPEEMDAKYTRTVAMSLVSYANLLECVTKLDAEKHSALLDSAKFWKLAKHKAGDIRKSFFVAVTQLCLKLPESLVSRGAQAVPAVLCNLQDTESGDALWTCVLQLLSTLPAAWTLVNPAKAVFPPVWKLLSSGADGKPHRVHPYLMPFLSKIPLTVMEDSGRFLNRWFAAMLEGLETVKEKKNESQCDTIVKAFLECMFYILNHKEIDLSMKQGLVREHLIPGLQKVCRNQAMFSSLSEYLLYWDRAAETNTDIAQLNLLFWSELKFLALGEELDIDFLIALANALGREQTKDTKNVLEKRQPLVDLMKIFESIWANEVANLTHSDKVAAALDTMYKILANLGHKSEIFSQKSAVDFYRENIVPLLTDLSLEEAVAQLTWVYAARQPVEPALVVLDLLVTGSRPSVISRLTAVARRSSDDRPLLLAWLRCPAVQGLVARTASELIGALVAGHTASQENWQMMQTVLGSGVQVPQETQEKLFSVFHQGLESIRAKEHKPNSVRLVEFVCDLLGLLAISHSDAIGEEAGTELIKVIFSLQSGGFSESTREKLERCWSLAATNQPSLFNILSKEIANLLAKPLTLVELEFLVQKARTLATLLAKTETSVLVDNLRSMMPNVERNLSEQAWYKIVFDQRQFFESVSDRFESSLIQQAEIEPINLVLVNRALVLTSVLCKGFGVDLSGDLEGRTVLDEERISLPEDLLESSDLVDLICEVPFLVVYMDNLVLDRNCSADIVRLQALLSDTASRLFSRLSKRNLDLLEAKLFEKCRDQSGLWSLGLGWVLGLTYKYSEWDLRLNRFLSMENDDISTSYNTLVVFLELISRFNLGAGTISSALSLAVAKLLSIDGLKTGESVCLLWFSTACLSLVRSGSRLHVSGLTEFAGELQALLELVPAWKTGNEDQLLYNVDLSEYSWTDVNRVCTVCNLLTLAVSRYTELVSADLWDLITCSLVSWVGSMQETKDSLTSRGPCLLFAITVSRLAATVGALLGPKGHHPALSVPVSATSQSEPPPKLREEWRDFFSEGIYTVLVPLYIQVCAGKEHLYSCNLLSSALGQALVHCPLHLLLQCDLPPLYLVQDVDAPPLADHVTFLLNHLGPLLSSPCRSSQVTAAHILAAVAQEIPQDVDVSGEGEECEVPRRLVEVLHQGEILLSTLLTEFSISDPVGDMPTGTVAFSQTFGYLLSWRIILRLLESSSDEVRPRYSQFLETRGHITSLLENIFKLLPSNSGALEAAFSAAPLEVEAAPSSAEIQQLAASCWIQVCGHLPAYARQWWSKLDRESQGTVEKITCAQVTPALWTQEVNIINAAEKSDNLTLKVRDSVREVVATYSIDEGSMELVVSLPSNYPLGGLNVDSGKRVGVETGQWRKWMLQLTTFLTHQNGSIYEGLNLWKKNVDKRFEGVEECYICFYILHGSNHQLPKLGCRTCKKKFHSACLYKWFSTSNNSSCPLCRNLF